ncbi:hypothetical protein PPACK8108_LOCUS23817 [Phakopsora pachyrhizi]|uniref:Mediator of RNA polymerase II transcription subunit 21 n=1 Tax=Phakopsora pachyrhizi TaxID=170000 RepID=A0AAV0BNC1_PHAPC|nr:hypothetical protein PPACK8108_LOCUS23817 [Phakopsora pachyrhizi]
MTSHDAELSRNMDRITQLQDAIDNLVTIMYSTISFLSRKADFKQVNPDVPITQSIPESNKSETNQETINQNCEELVADFMRKAKQIEYLISILPPSPGASLNISKNGDSYDSQPAPFSSTLTSSSAYPPLDITSSASTLAPIKGNSTDDPQINDTPVEKKNKEEFKSLKSDLQAAQAEYDQALFLAKSLRSEVQAALRMILDERAHALASA